MDGCYGLKLMFMCDNWSCYFLIITLVKLHQLCEVGNLLKNLSVNMQFGQIRYGKGKIEIKIDDYRSY